MNPQVDPALYFTMAYNSKGRFISYWHQINEILMLNPESTLEIGVGNGMLRDFLKHAGLKVATLDIDARLKPDYLGSVLNMPFPSASFDLVACYETLEHQPYTEFPRCLSEIHRVCKNNVIISLPDCTRVYRFSLQVPKLGEIKRLIPLPRFKTPTHIFDGQHYWEIGKAGYPLDRICAEIQRTGFVIEKVYRVFEIPYHRFFVLKKILAKASNGNIGNMA